MTTQQDKRYFLDDSIKGEHKYKVFQMEIEDNGHYTIVYKGYPVRVYSASLAYLFTSQVVPVCNKDGTTINGCDYLKTYVESYKEGEGYFITTYGPNPETQAENINRYYSHTGAGNGQGWRFVRGSNPFKITYQDVKKQGYYSGIVKRLEDFIQQGPEGLRDYKPKAANSTPPKVKAEFKEFKDLFYKPEFVAPCIELLKELDPPIIDVDCNYIGKLKGALCVWISEMEHQGIIKACKDRKLYPLLINQQIKGLSISESMFTKKHHKAEELYGNTLKLELSQKKLSLRYQKTKQIK